MTDRNQRIAELRQQNYSYSFTFAVAQYRKVNLPPKELRCFWPKKDKGRETTHSTLSKLWCSTAV